MHKFQEVEPNKKRAVAIWLIAGVVMIIIQTLLGGVTRLTGSGLSITKWSPLFGFLPPLNAHQWEAAFNGYKEIGQFKIMNSTYNLEDFKTIFFWEWFHRFWARMLGVVFAIGFAYFFLKNYFDKKMIKPFIILFLLGGLQGLIGWLMVKTGLNSEDVHVNYIALSIHFISAMILASYTLWFALQLLIPEEKRVHNTSLRNFTLIITGVLFVQLMYGAFMAGLKAAVAAPTWPLINGHLIPETLLSNGIFSDPYLSALSLNVHFMHRGIAYLLIGLILVWFLRSRKQALAMPGSVLLSTAKWPIVIVLIQVLLGIFAVLSAPMIRPGKFGTFEIIAETHQMVAMFLLMSLIVNFYVLSGQKSS